MPVDLTILPDELSEAATTLAKKIDFDSVNAKGGNGYVLMGRNRHINRRVAVKFYYWGDGTHAEPKLLSDLASPHVLKVEDAAAIDADWAYFITPFCEAGDLDDVIQRGGIGVKRAVDILLDVASGTSFIHGKGFLHRDLKPNNVFCEDSGRLVIGDFGSVVKKGEHGYTETTSRHSLIYRTPEEISSGRAYEQGDVYQLGIILYQLLGGSLPYDEQAWLTSKQLAHYHTLASPDDQLYAQEIIHGRIVKGRLLDFGSLPPWCPTELVAVIRKSCRVALDARFESVAALIAKLNNLRAGLSDWRLEPEPILYRPHAKFKIVGTKGHYTIEKMAKAGSTWRKVHSVPPSLLKNAVASALML